MKIVICLLGLFLTMNSMAYDVVNRFKLIDDNFKTDKMLRPFGHDFLIDLNILFSDKIFDVVGDASDAAKASTNAEKTVLANSLLLKYNNTEQNGVADVTLGIPLPRFSPWNVKIVPNFRANVRLGSLMAVTSQVIDINNFLELLPSDITITGTPTLPAAGTDIADALLAQGVISQADRDKYTGKFTMPAGGTTPNILVYGKLEGKGGLFNQYTKGKYFGTFNSYVHYRRDCRIRLTAASIANDVDPLDACKDGNTQVDVSIDYSIGYKFKYLNTYLSVEEVKLLNLKEEKNEVGVVKPLLGGNDPLIRLHADSKFSFLLFDLQPFVGLHKRSGYDLGDGYYLGADLRASVWKDRLALRFRSMIDSEHLTISPLLKVWFMQFEYMLKNPIGSDIEGIKAPTIHAANVRFFF
jgi:hypothetical protein